ncbi:hypothetical protein BCF11_0147 [Collimonas sp. PA-H2]|uniref:hypothetical protein n=1 Tax=Collimonas sp. PA-H2 TaxID=1881062 RepID=UPI000C003909|nr:hypothetical protein [Collimonas sp. PA-H2]PFH07807.1 hypothetical protein BCF11_0147 [Collimonas sp. PA-H2]
MNTNTISLIIILGLSSSVLAQSPPTPPEIPDETQPMPPGIKPPPTPSPTSPTLPGMQSEAQQLKAPPLSVTTLHVQPKTENGFTYLCGGVGLDESNYMKRTAKTYDLMSTFASRSGSYLADVNIDISDKNGKATLQTTCSAPILLIRFPRTGTYSIRAEVGGDAQTKVVVKEKRGTQSIVFVWPAN